MFSLFNTKNQPLNFPPLQLFNTESRSLEIFEPLSNKEVRIYSCGPTVYDYVHIGNLRAYVFVDTLKRTLLYNGYVVNHTINYTDFGHLSSDADTGDDKMMKGLRREKMDVSLESMRLLSDRYIKAFNNDLEALNIIKPTQFARASDYVNEQIRLIETLEQKGYTYETSDGIYFDISKFPTYGRLGNIDLDGQQSANRTEINPEKHHPADFALWKYGTLGWKSKWGLGFPGWHIECSAMAFATLGKQIDIHTGGVDNIPTHHNGEIAQCESATGKQFSKYWMHSEHLQINNQKIAKSDGNGLTMNELYQAGYSALEYRYWLLTSHYRTKVNFSYEALEASKQAFTKLRKLIFVDWADEKGRPDGNYQQKAINIINDDLNTPQVIALIWEIVKDDKLTKGEKRATIVELDGLLGLGLDSKSEDGAKIFSHLKIADLPEAVQVLIEEREIARVARNWPEADRIRAILDQQGYLLEDSSEGVKVSKK
ncbi:cysteine--tRNA ligase [Candidatus Kaiserbacteria bacterium]|nr:cysteine--tRNA ligase [Candidatus Kaiserbacteria bacterium]